MANARTAVRAFGDSFDDATSGNDFSLDVPTADRWAVARNHPDIRCDNVIETAFGADKAMRASCSKAAGEPGAYWTNAIYQAAYPPGTLPQIVTLRVKRLRVL